MNLGEQYIEQLNTINAISERERELKKVKQGLQKQIEKTKQAIIDAHFDDGECFDDLGIHMQKVNPRVIVTDENKIPDEFFKTERVLMKAKLNDAIKADGLIEGTALDNGGHTIQYKAKGK